MVAPKRHWNNCLRTLWNTNNSMAAHTVRLQTLATAITVKKRIIPQNPIPLKRLKIYRKRVFYREKYVVWVCKWGKLYSLNTLSGFKHNRWLGNRWCLECFLAYQQKRSGKSVKTLKTKNWKMYSKRKTVGWKKHWYLHYNFTWNIQSIFISQRFYQHENFV